MLLTVPVGNWVTECYQTVMSLITKGKLIVSEEVSMDDEFMIKAQLHNLHSLHTNKESNDSSLVDTSVPVYSTT